MDRQRLTERLTERFDADPARARVVARAAGDLADSGRYAADFQTSLTIDVVLANLRDAPDDSTVDERWNWWMGALELSHGGYSQFDVRQSAV
ncbi:MAG: hypothetical protein ABEI98_01275 [Halorhabdus sp.]